MTSATVEQSSRGQEKQTPPEARVVSDMPLLSASEYADLLKQVERGDKVIQVFGFSVMNQADLDFAITAEQNRRKVEANKTPEERYFGRRATQPEGADDNQAGNEELRKRLLSVRQSLDLTQSRLQEAHAENAALQRQNSELEEQVRQAEIDRAEARERYSVVLESNERLRTQINPPQTPGASA